MAKAKKPEAAGATAAGKTSKKAAGGKAAGKAGGAKKSAAPAPAGPAHAPQIDTRLAASAAAAMILNRAVTGGAGGSGAAAPPRAESAGFKHLKQGLNQPAGGGLGGLLGGTGQPKKSNQNYGGGKQVGRNQTFGADVNRAGVPRRTGGG